MNLIRAKLKTSFAPNDVRELNQRKLVCETLRELARSLASDRSTKFLPIIFSQAAFAALFILQLGRTGSKELGKHNWIPIEVHSVAFSELFLWLIYAIFLSAVIGVSQTELEIPRQLNQARRRLQESNWLITELPTRVERSEVRYNLFTTKSIPRKDIPSSRKELDYKMRILSGGMYHCRPALHMQESDITLRTKVQFIATAFVIVVLAVVPASVMSSLVPPLNAFGTRNACQVGIFGFWLISAAFDLGLARFTTKDSLPYKAMFAKDMVFILCVIFIILATQIGILNSCKSWTNWGKGPLVIPQLPPYADIIYQRIGQGGAWLVTTWLGIVAQLVLCTWTAAYYLPAFRVYLQRDDGKSNLRWLEECQALLDLGNWLERKRRRLTREGEALWASQLFKLLRNRINKWERLYREFFDQRQRNKRNTLEMEMGKSSSTDLNDSGRRIAESNLLIDGNTSITEEPEAISQSQRP
jgi:hypothetical protein